MALAWQHLRRLQVLVVTHPSEAQLYLVGLQLSTRLPSLEVLQVVRHLEVQLHLDQWVGEGDSATSRRLQEARSDR